MSLFKKEEQSEAQISKELLEKVDALKKELAKTVKDIEELQKKVQHTVTKIGVMRFNPFKEIGGDQSFCIALLDEKQNGLVITSYYGRDLNRVYAKEIEHGASKYDLCEEEKEAIKKAMNV